MIKKEIELFFIALMFYTRIPVPKWVEFSTEKQNLSTKYFPLIGWIVGGLSAAVFYGSTFIFPETISVLLAIIASILLTGAFHEDGFADTCDAFGGGWTKEKILEIMKDSRIGTYGVVGLVLILLLKFFLLGETSAINPYMVIVVLIIAQSLSRFVVTSFIYTHEYVRPEETSKVKPQGKMLNFSGLGIACICGVLPLLVAAIWFNYFFLLVIVPVFIEKWLLAIYFNRRIGGYTGDCLGAMQQVSEILIYLSFLCLWKFI